MENTFFKKMKVKPGFIARVINEPKDYPRNNIDFIIDDKATECDFVHVFVNSQEDFEKYIELAKSICKKDALLWISYPKVKGKVKYDINRDSLWDLALNHNLHPVSQISINDDYSAVRLKFHNESEKGEFKRPNKK